MEKMWLFFLILLPEICHCQIINTFAGTGSASYSGENGPATVAGIPDPSGGAFDKFGNYYFASGLSGNRICKIDTFGIITTVAGTGSGTYGGDNGPATLAQLYMPSAVRLDSLGNLFISDFQNFRIRKVDTKTGIITTIAGTGTAGYNGDNIPATSAMIYGVNDLYLDKQGNLYFSDEVNERIRKVTASGIIINIAGTGTGGYNGDKRLATSAEISFPAGLVIDDTGNIYFAEAAGNRVRKIDTFGFISTYAGNGTPTYTGDGIPATNAQINPNSLAIDSFNNLFIGDRYNERVFKVNTMGVLNSLSGTGVAGDAGDGSAATAAELYTPNGVAVDACGNLYIPTAGSVSVPGSGCRIRKITYNIGCNPHRLGSDNYDSVALGVSILPEGTISIFPNPAMSSFTVESANKIAMLTITNLIGQAIYTQNAATNKLVVDAACLPPGIYIVKVTDLDGRKTITKIIKQ